MSVAKDTCATCGATFRRERQRGGLVVVTAGAPCTRPGPGECCGGFLLCRKAMAAEDAAAGRIASGGR